MARMLTLGFGVLFGVVVSLGYIPALISVHEHHRTLMGLYELSLLDDITHGVTALFAFIAAAASRKACILFLTAFGFYYGLDAIFFLTWGFFNERPFHADILLNLPHVIIAAIMLGYVYRLAPREVQPAA
jgi:MFS-type transporter involved in bile tolerance (Atg22 family)